MLDGLVVPIYQAAYGAIEAMAALLWIINQALLGVGYYLMVLTSWLSDTAFAPIMTQVIGQTSGLLAPIVIIALLLLAITYFLRLFINIEIVEFKRAFMWLLTAIMVFQFGPELYQGTEDMRRGLGSVFYEEGFNSLSLNSSSINGLSAIGTTPEISLGTLSNNFSMWLPTDVGIDGLDVAMAYLFADGCDVLRSSGCTTLGFLPKSWYLPASGNAYFDNTASGDFYPIMDNDQRRASLEAAMNGLARLATGIIVSLFGLLEQIIHLILSLAMGIAYLSLIIAVLFGFFKKTEPIAWAVINLIIGLFVQSLITSLLLSVVMTLVIVGAGTGNAVLLLGASIVGIILLVVLLVGAINAIKGSINGLIGAMSTATGGHLISVTQASGMVGGAAMSATAGMIATARTGSVMQGAGVALSGNQTLARGAMMAASTFGEESLLGSMAHNFHAGASAGQFMGSGAAAFLLPGQEQMEQQGLYPGSSPALGTPIRSNDLSPEDGGRPHDQLRQNRADYLASGQNPSVLANAYQNAGLEDETLGKAFDSLNEGDFEEGLRAYNGARQRHPQDSNASPAQVRGSFTSRLSPDNPLASDPNQADAFIAAADASVNDYRQNMAVGRTARRIAREDVDDAGQDDTSTAPTPLGTLASPSASANLSSLDVARLDAAGDDDFANLSASIAASLSAPGRPPVAQRIDPVTNDPYTFQKNTLGGGYLRQYEDGKTVPVNGDDMPMHYANLNNPKIGNIERPAGYVDTDGQLSYAIANPGDDAGYNIHPDAVASLPPFHTANPDAPYNLAQQEQSATHAAHEDGASSTVQNTTNEGANNTALPLMPTMPDFDTSALAASIDSSLEEVEEVGRNGYQEPLDDSMYGGHSNQEEPPSFFDMSPPGVSFVEQAPVAPQATPSAPPPVPQAAPVSDDFTAIRGIGTHTQRALNDAGIHSYSDLAQASPERIQAAVPRVSADNAQRYTQQAAELASGQIAAPAGGLTPDMSGIVSALQAALSNISVGMGNKEASQTIAQAAGVPAAAAMPAVGYYARMASGMGLSPQTAAQVVQDTAQNGQMGQDVAQSVRQALSSFQTPSGGQLGDAGMQQAVNSLQQAASAMTNAVNTGGASSGTQVAGTPQAGGNTTNVNVQAASATIGKAADVGSLDQPQGE